MTDDLPSAVRSEHTRARVTLYLLAAGLVLTLIAIGSGIAQARMLEAIRTGVEVSAEHAEANDARQRLIGLAEIIVFLATVVAWLIWQHRAYANLRLVGSRETEYTPGWSVGYWFIPILNLFRPYQITAELWRRSELCNGRDPIGSLSRPPLILGWWVVYLALGLLGRAYFSTTMNAKTLTDFIAATDLGLVHDSLSVVSTILAIIVVRGIDRFQQEFVAAGTTSPALST
jgi:hypothetical protein